MSKLFTGFQLLLWLSPRYYSDLFDNGRSIISYRVVVVVLTFLLMSTREGWKQGDLSSEDRQRLWGSERWRGIWSSYITMHIISCNYRSEIPWFRRGLGQPDRWPREQRLVLHRNHIQPTLSRWNTSQSSWFCWGIFDEEFHLPLLPRYVLN